MVISADNAQEFDLSLAEILSSANMARFSLRHGAKILKIVAKNW
jgi:hypothetical protein